jgi:hypothetical protein
VAILAVCLTTAGAADGPDLQSKWDQIGAGVDNYGLASYIDDVNGAALTADDFLCTQPGWITDIRFAGWSYYGNQHINQFRVTFYADVPAAAGAAGHPGDLIYEQLITAASPADPLDLGWRDLGDGTFRISLPRNQWFHQDGTQESPIVYWIGIQGVMQVDGSGDLFYWNAVGRNQGTWGDGAAFASQAYGYEPWANWGWPSVDPQTGAPSLYTGAFPAGWAASADTAFAVSTPEPASMALLGLGGLMMLLRRRRAA